MYKSVLLSIACAACAFAQSEVAPDKTVTLQLKDPGPLAPNLFYVSVGGSPSPIAGAPYSAQSTTDRVQVLSDGNRIEQTTSANVARDSQGRVRIDSVPVGMTLPSGDAPHLISIDDPVAGVRYTLDSTNKIAIKFPASKMPAPPENLGGGPLAVALPAAPGLPPPNVLMTARARVEPEIDQTKVDLGSQTMEGVPVQGTRLTRTIPAGSMGNEQPIVITTETWYSPALKVLVRSKSSDPRIGETTYTLTNIQRAEPPAALFQVPADYTVKEAPGPVFFQKLTAPKQ